MSDGEGNQFKNGLFSCFGDCNVCLCSVFCPCISSSKIRAWMDEREHTWADCLCSCAVNNHAFGVRQTMKKKFGYDLDHTTDCLLAWCCACCVVGQNQLEAREHGFEKEIAEEKARKAAEMQQDTKEMNKE